MTGHLHRRSPAQLAEDARWEDDGGALVRERDDAPQWRRIAAALSARLPELSGREDLLVTIDQHTRSGAPAAFFPSLAAIEMAANVFAPLVPKSIRPERVGDEERYPVAWGALVHEAAHAAHSRWTTPLHLRGTAADEAAQLLEESRAEHRHLARRSADRQFLRRAVHRLVLDDLADPQVEERWQAGQAAGLILARRDAGVLDEDEAQPVAEAVEHLLGAETLDRLAAIWTDAHTTGDDDTEAMLALGRAWCESLGARPEEAPPVAMGGGSGSGSAVAEAARQAAGSASAHQRQEAEAGADARAVRAKAAASRKTDRARDRAAAAQAEKVFAPAAGAIAPGGRRNEALFDPRVGSRNPLAAERRAAAVLARALRAAAARERTERVTTSAAPPGRLVMRAALARDAQRAAGAVPSAEPWKAVQRRHVPNPPLRVGIAVDVSGSMAAATGPMASAAWITAQACTLTDPNSRSAALAFSTDLTALTRPGRAPRHVPYLLADGGGQCLAEAADALTSALALDRPGAGRLLVVASDGFYTPAERAFATDRLNQLAASGCAVLQIAFDDQVVPLPHATVLIVADPASAVAAVATAATTALRNAC
ncbi:hypothetical protein BIV57_11290 [Mangrovactinospora gilvigrisea]|uniref:VWA domain-containing protein n=1 Tax=Mangrovactinospora gilvigrisea TaxID=1428644 RepID=A0A1J7BV82_9ACTN|nr:VWA domain-containing protein [Mangrovactinospora gilvigrisea]OIV37393.1 hypothetical protein BIV57_11290 [Mangrovactinospora gilvigrisea]